jgi:hypothetical protein
LRAPAALMTGRSGQSSLLAPDVHSLRWKMRSGKDLPGVLSIATDHSMLQRSELLSL